MRRDGVTPGGFADLLRRYVENGGQLLILGKSFAQNRIVEEGVDYEKTETGVNLLDSDLWAKNAKGEYIDSPNGARYLRYMVTLGHDIIDRDPLIKQSKSKSDAYRILTEWEEFMKARQSEKKLKVLLEDSRVKWMQTEKKLENSGKLLDSANTMVMSYTFGKKNMNEYTEEMTKSTWKDVLAEINNALK